MTANESVCDIELYNVNVSLCRLYLPYSNFSIDDFDRYGLFSIFQFLKGK